MTPGRATDTRAELRADCAGCSGLCCVAVGFARSAEFALTKPAGRPCPHLDGDDRCAIHGELRRRGFPGCAAFDCFGAGQRVTRLAGSWRAGSAAEVFTAFDTARHLHELLWYLAEARERAEGPLAARAARLQRRITARTGEAADLAGAELTALRSAVGTLLAELSTRVRGPRPGPDHRGADLTGARLHGARLRAGTLRGALLLGADLRDADLRDADLLGTDLRGADLRGADLRGALFLTGPQLAGARGDARTRLPGHLSRPAHWPR